MGKWHANISNNEIPPKKHIDIDYRSIINVPTNFTFGLEMETEYANYLKIKNFVESNYRSLGWNHCLDRTLNSGIEVTSPILRDSYDCWQQVNSMCKFLNDNSQIGPNCGGHIHLGFHVFENNPIYLYNFLLLWVAFEDIIYKFLYGEYDTNRKNILSLARPISIEIFTKNDRLLEIIRKQSNSYSKLKEMLKLLNDDYDRYKGLNLCYLRYIEEHDKIIDKNTVEIRCPNGTLNESIWQNNVNFLIHLIMYAKSDLFDYKFIIDKIREKRKNGTYLFIKNYSKINFDDAIDLANLIFDTELDKLYFLKQYLKSDSNDFELLKQKTISFI